MGAVKSLAMDAAAGDAGAQRLLAAIAASADRRRAELAAALGLVEADCPACEGNGEVVHADPRGPEYDYGEPCRLCGGWGFGYHEPDDPHGAWGLLAPDALEGAAERRAATAAAPLEPPVDEGSAAEDGLPF